MQFLLGYNNLKFILGLGFRRRQLLMTPLWSRPATLPGGPLRMQIRLRCRLTRHMRRRFRPTVVDAEKCLLRQYFAVLLFFFCCVGGSSFV